MRRQIGIIVLTDKRTCRCVCFCGTCYDKSRFTWQRTTRKLQSL